MRRVALAAERGWIAAAVARRRGASEELALRPPTSGRGQAPQFGALRSWPERAGAALEATMLGAPVPAPR